uniref:Uncharacterized protein n=1 Tax=Phlebia radiata TaxID=5308 RepID=L8B9E9_PHLRA|nr:hypothetical protein PRA_mt0090 [Phlebia radiata]CCE89199.1 hypothetical protein PRA_mt0090 [Phlebia radiata]
MFSISLMFLDKPLFKADFNVKIFNKPWAVKCYLLLIISTILTKRLKSTFFLSL